MFMPIQCDWCGQPIKGGSFQVIASKGIQAIGARRAIFHPRCGAAVISICDTGIAPKAQGQKPEATVAPKPAAKQAPKKDPVQVSAEPVVEPKSRSRGWRLPPIAKRPEPKPKLPVKGQKGETKKRRYRSRGIEPETKPERPPVDSARVLDLQSRGFRPNQIAAQLRAPYAEVNRIIQEAA